MANRKKELDPRVFVICNKLREIRKEKGHSSAENFAFDNDLNRVQYWRAEKGANITLETLLRILDKHKITLKDFINSLD